MKTVQGAAIIPPPPRRDPPRGASGAEGQSMQQRIIVGISGASGIVYGVRALQMLGAAGVETHLVISKSAELTLHHEMDLSLAELKALASEVHPVKNVGASIASGSFPTQAAIEAWNSMALH